MCVDVRVLYSLESVWIQSALFVCGHRRPFISLYTLYTPGQTS